MPYPISNEVITRVATKLDALISNAYGIASEAQTEALSNNYGPLLDIPADNKKLQDFLSLAVALNSNTEILAEINRIRNASITISDITDFTNAYGSLATDIEANSSAFTMTFNASTKAKEFKTPVSAPIQAAINDRLASLLATVS